MRDFKTVGVQSRNTDAKDCDHRVACVVDPYCPRRFTKHRCSKARGQHFSRLSRDTSLFGAAQRIDLWCVVSAFCGILSGLADGGDVKRDEHPHSGCDACERLDFLKPYRRLICSDLWAQRIDVSHELQSVIVHRLASVVIATGVTG